MKFAQKYGYKIQVIKGYSLTKNDNVFKSYIDNIYEIKSKNTNKAIRSIAKLLLNSLLGRFGLRLDSNNTEIVDNTKLNLIAYTRAINSHVQLNDNLSLANYNKKIDIDLCNKSCIDIAKISDLWGDQEYNKQSGYENVSVAISAAITAYARMHMSKIKLDLLN